MINNSLNITTNNIKQKNISNDPFSHFYIHGVFPEELFDKINNNWPDLDFFENGKKLGINIEAERFYFKLDKANIRKLKGEKRFFWEKIEKWLISDRLIISLLKKYKKDLNYLPENNIENYYLQELKPKVRFNTSLVMDVGGYELRPHSDDERVILNLLFYLPKNDCLKELGTSIYTPKEAIIPAEYQNKPIARFPREWFNLVKTFPYQPNSLFSFVRSNHSFHGVEPSQNKDHVRKLMLLSLMFNDS
ncbi:MAG: hypothetical protein CFH01_00970 [Alphaproteobacteria bacterium MarineAlpha2_Bin1]|nr:MAG: hypothetical protein CFH01_00970 [Alphaproteobacteria bacterium MarineAlpha2_Bin1]|tara:strand:+ start:479 stop:1222 length:744 start_codon:yes stop_codon:yes gene_type:complete